MATLFCVRDVVLSRCSHLNQPLLLPMHCPDDKQQGNCNKAVSVIAEYLESVNMYIYVNKLDICGYLFYYKVKGMK